MLQGISTTSHVVSESETGGTSSAKLEHLGKARAADRVVDAIVSIVRAAFATMIRAFGECIVTPLNGGAPVNSP